MNIGEFFSNYWFQIFAPFILIVGTIIFYCKSDDITRKKIKKIAPLIAVAVFWIIIRKFWNNYLLHWKSWDIWFGLFIFIYCLYFLFIFREKYETAGFVVAEGCPVACYSTEPVIIGKYTIFNCGSSNKTFRIEEGDFILVVPTKLITWLGAVAVCNVQVTRRDINSLPYKLPEAVSNYILTDKYLNKNCIYFGMFDKTTLLYGKPFNIEGKTLTYKDFENEFCNLNQRINMLQEHAEGRKISLEQEAQFIKRFKKSLDGKNQFSIESRKSNEEEFGSQ